jgi:crossover junction endodeoxyribonuclease RuvC
MIILGIDPGLANTGFGAIRCSHSPPMLVKCGLMRTSPKDHVSQRLFQIYSDLNQLIDVLKPELMAVENVFSLVRYPKAGIMLGGVMGVLYLSAFKSGTRVIEVMPREVKNALAAFGGASKVQVREVTKKVLAIDAMTSFHAADALAVALTVFYRNYRGRDDIIPGRYAKKGAR